MRFRPADDPRNRATEGDPNPGGPVEWEDNWLSNLFAWGSFHVIPNWCQSEDHFSAKITKYLFTDCPCCLFWRGVTVGFLPGLLMSIVLLLIMLVRS